MRHEAHQTAGDGGVGAADVGQRRGLPRGTGFQGAPCPRCDGPESDEAAYALLLGCYLGDGHVARARRGVFTLQIVDDQKYPDLNRDIFETIKLVKLADWQREIVAKYPEQLSDESEDIRNILTETLDLLGIKWRQPRRNVIAVSRREAVAALDGFVGPKS